jgi:uncharacterized protein (DUF924 family)
LASDLGAEGAEVHAKAREVLGFWFELLMPEQWFAKSDSLDDEIRTLFAPLRDDVLASGAQGWRDDPDTLLAAILLLDQFSRNIHRGSAQAFAADPLAQELARLALERGWDKDMRPERRLFLYLPFQHAEDRELQAVSLQLYEALGVDETLAFARAHAEVIARFGRFPTRNAALGRQSTPEEEEYLRQPGVGW